MSKKQYISQILPLPAKNKYIIHDYWMGLVVALKGKIAYLDEKTIKYRQHGNNQVGTNKISHGFSKLKDVRDLFINVKIGIFSTYVENEKIFPEDLKVQNRKSMEYFTNIKSKKYMNFKGWLIFHKLYKNETLSYYIINFMIMNFPIIVTPFFKLRYILKNRNRR